jgi:hypothetical protein
LALAVALGVAAVGVVGGGTVHLADDAVTLSTGEVIEAYPYG